MKAVAQQVWREPAVFIGLLTSILLALIAILDGADWDTQTIIGVVAPFAASLGIRQAVTPAAGPRDTPG
jgi:hypothetical protein